MNDVYVRKMASIQEVNGVHPIEGADKICQYGINGWRVVDQVGKYQVGDRVIFCEVDSFIPSTIAPFLTKAGHFPKVYNGVEGEKLRTIRLRKALSQGLILPMSIFGCGSGYDEPADLMPDYKVGDDVSEVLGIVKWEAPPEFTSADARGSFPSFIIKTDQERVQNCYDDVAKYFDTETWEETEKCEGSSMTVYFRDGDFGVCSRNLDLKESEDNTFWKMALELDLKTKLTYLGKNVAIQGELCGPGIQGNIYNLTKHMFFVFDVFNIDKFEYYAPVDRRELTALLELTDAPVYNKERVLAGISANKLLAHADGQSVLGQVGCLREGIVYKANSGKRISFKCVSNLYLEGEK